MTGDGTGITIAIVDAYDDPDLKSQNKSGFVNSDLHMFDMQYGLPEPPGFFVKENQNGVNGSYPGTDTVGPGNNNWEAEEALDVEWTHAIAPGAKIILIEANDSSNNIFTAATFAGASSGAQIVSMSWGGPEFDGENTFDTDFVSPSSHGVTFVASTGDGGQPGEYPAYSPNVVAVGGTTLFVTSGGDYSSEVGWAGSGGGISQFEPQPSYQTGITPSSTARTIPDISFDADPSTGVAVYDSYNGNVTGGPWYQFGGTSLAAPSMAAIISIADQGRAAQGLGSLNGLTQTLPILYSLPSSDYHDITTGNNGFPAGPGYDLVTGIGSPVPSTFVPDLASVRVLAATPANNATLTTAPTTFIIPFSDSISLSSLQPSDLSVDGIGATSVALNATHTIATFTYATSPVTTSGAQTMSIAAGAVTAAASATATNAAFNSTFYFETSTLGVASTNPPTGSILNLPGNSYILDVVFNKPIDPSTVGVGNLTLSQGSVSAAAVLAGNETVAYTITGLTTPGTLTVTIPAGTLKDQFDNPAFTPFTGTYLLDEPTMALPTPLVRVAPFGSLAYGTSAANVLLFPGDTDSFTLAADPGETLTVLVTPAVAGLAPTVQLSDPSNTVLASASAAGAGQNVLLQTIATTTSGTYTVTVGGLFSTTGNYTVQVFLDTALEAASLGIGFDDTLAAAQNLNPSFLPLQTALASGSRAAVIGGVAQPVTVNASASGWWDSTGSHTASNSNYLVGQVFPTQYRDFFAFNLNAVNVPILSAQLNVFNPSTGYSSPLSSDTYSLFDVSTPISSLEATGGGQTSIFNDLGSGVSYGSQSITTANNGGNVSITLNAAGVAALNSDLGGQFAVGGALTSIVGSDTQTLFGFSGLSPGAVQLVLTLADTRYYSFTLGAGELATVGLENLAGSGDSITLQNSSGVTLATGTAGAADLSLAISNFVAPSAGTYYIAVSGSTNATYSLVVTRDATFDTGSHNTLATAQNVTGTQGVLGGLVAGQPDWYQVTLGNTQNALAVQTSTPLSGPSQSVNTLTPIVQLFNSSDTLVAVGTLTADGRNQTLLVTGLTPGATYYVEVSAASNGQGEYFAGITPLQTPTVTSDPSNDAVTAGQLRDFHRRRQWQSHGDGAVGSQHQQWRQLHARPGSHCDNPDACFHRSRRPERRPLRSRVQQCGRQRYHHRRHPDRQLQWSDGDLVHANAHRLRGRVHGAVP